MHRERTGEPQLEKWYRQAQRYVWGMGSWVRMPRGVYSQGKGKVVQSCLTLCGPMDYTFHGILQARILEWVAFPFSRGSF